MDAPDHSMTVVDSHVHWWDPANEWMIMATQEQADELGMGEIGPMKRRYLPAEYLADTSAFLIEKVVWVMATLSEAGHLAEVSWVRQVAGDEKLLGAVIGSVSPRLSATERRTVLARQADWELFRGVRVIGELDYASTVADEYMRMLADHGLVYDHMGHHQTMSAAARLAERHSEVPWILEHCGWPQWPGDPGYVSAWREGIRVLASVGNVHCKLSGLAMGIHSFSARAQRPFIEHCLEQFGPKRCMFGSNFPVDRLYGSFDHLMEMFLSVTAGLSPEARHEVLYSTAERVYRL